MDEARQDPRAVAGKWRRPYSSVQWAWVRALGLEPSRKWDDDRGRRRQ